MYIRQTSNTRREFIKQSLAAAGMLSLFNSCGVSSTPGNPTVDPDAIKRLIKTFAGRIIIPGDNEYDKARRVLSSSLIDKRPALVAQCKNEDDILRCIDFAHQQSLEVAVRSGNHSFLGWGTCDNGIVIDLSTMKGVAVDPSKQTARVITGSNSEEILHAASAHHLAPALGQCGTVGAGVLLGGGLGWLSGKYGATCDNLISARIITADGRTVTADALTNDELFWAIRGGGGNFGVATAFEYRLHPLNEVLAGRLTYPINKARDVVRFFRDFMATAPDELQADCYVSGPDNGNCTIEIVYIGELAKGQQHVEAFRKFSTPDHDSIKPKSFSEIYNVDLGSVAPCPFELSKGTYLDQFSDDTIDLILERTAQPPPSCTLGFNFSHYMHGEVCRIAPDATAFGLRNAGAVHLNFWVGWKDSTSAEDCLNWHNKTFELLQPFANGHIYANYMSVSGESASKRAFGNNYARLAELKKKFDPNNFFHLNQNILPSKAL